MRSELTGRLPTYRYRANNRVDSLYCLLRMAPPICMRPEGPYVLGDQQAFGRIHVIVTPRPFVALTLSIGLAPSVAPPTKGCCAVT